MNAMLPEMLYRHFLKYRFKCYMLNGFHYWTIEPPTPTTSYCLDYYSNSLPERFLLKYGIFKE
jgi:hypothetical protein